MEIGKKIKGLRLKMGLTQEELAERSEVTKGFISQLERDLTSPSVSTLSDIVEALGSNLTEFFNEPEKEKVVFDEEDAFINYSEETKSEIKWVVPNAQKNMMEPILLTLDQEGESRRYLPFEGEEFGYLLKGKIKLFLNDEEYIIKKGNFFYTKANFTRRVLNIAKGKSVLLWISTPPNF